MADSQTTPRPSTATPTTQLPTIKLFNAKYLLIIVLIFLAYAVVHAYIPIISTLIWTAFLIICYSEVSKLKHDPNKAISESDKTKAVLFMAIDPAFAQAFYYYRLRKVNLETANAYNKLGWKILGIEFILIVILVVIDGSILLKKYNVSR